MAVENLSRMEPVVATGAAAIAESFPPSAKRFVIRGIRLHMNAAPTSSEDFTITHSSVHGAAYDTVCYAVDLAAGSTTDVYYSEPIYGEAGDYVDVAYTNTDTGTYGLTILGEVY